MNQQRRTGGTNQKYSNQNNSRDRGSSHYAANADAFLTGHPFNSEWIQNGADASMIEFAEKVGEELKNQQLTTSQFRNVFGELKRIQMSGLNESNLSAFLLLKPKLAYAEGRSGSNRGMKLLRSYFDQAWKVVADSPKEAQPERFERLVQFFEAIIAYHKAAGGK